MTRYSAEWVQAQVEAVGATQLLHHDCSICGVWVRYLFRDGQVWFDSSCGCGFSSPPILRSFGAIAEWLAMQSSDDIRDNIMKGLRS